MGDRREIHQMEEAENALVCRQHSGIKGVLSRVTAPAGRLPKIGQVHSPWP